jgi:hypothetical protein
MRRRQRENRLLSRVATPAWVAVGALAALVVTSGVAYAYLSATGSGSGSASTTTFSPPTGVTATTPSAGTVQVAWTAPTAPDGGDPTGYTVARSDGSTTNPACGTGTAALAGTATSCDDTSVPPGTYTYTVTAEWSSWTATSAPSASVTVVAGTLDHFSVIPLTLTPTAGTQFTVTIIALNQFGLVVPTYTGSQCVTFSGPGTSPTPSSTAPAYPAGSAGCTGNNSLVTFLAGVGTANVTLFKAESTALAVTDVATSKTGSASLTVSAAGIDRLLVAPSTSTPMAGTSFTAPLTAHDLYDNVADSYSGSKTITWSALATSPAPASQAPSYPTSAVTFTAGASTTTLTATGYAAGANTLTATDAGGKAGSASLTVSAAAASKLAFSTQPSNANGGATIAPAPTVAVQDAYSNAITTDTSSVSVAIGTNPSGGTLSGTATVAAASGVATFSGLSINTAGTGYTLVATSGSLTSATSSSFNITVGPAAKLAFTQQPNGATAANGVFPTQPKVTAQDAGGNTVTSYATAVTLAMGTNPTGAALACTTNPVTPVSGVATFAGCRVSLTGNGYTLRATSGTLTLATSTSFNVTGAATKLVFTTQPGGGTAAVAWAQQPVVSVTDAANNVVTAYPASSVALGLTAGTGGTGAALTCNATSVTTSNGVAAFSGCSINKTATNNTLTATRAGLTNGVSSAFTITPGPATQMTFWQAVTSGTLAGSPLSPQPLVFLLDAQGNLATNYVTPITLAITSGTGTPGAVLGCTTNPVTPAAGSGYVAFAGCSIDRWGNAYTLTATSGSLTATSSAFDVFGYTPALTLTNKAGGTAGRPEAGDTIAITYPNPVAAGTLCGGWSGATTLTSVTVSFTNSGGDKITGITDTADCTGTSGFRAAAGVGSILLGTTNKYFTSATGSFTNGSATWNSSTNTLTITLGGLASGTVATGTNTTGTYTPDATLSVPASATFTTANGRQF